MQRRGYESWGQLTVAPLVSKHKKAGKFYIVFLVTVLYFTTDC